MRYLKGSENSLNTATDVKTIFICPATFQPIFYRRPYFACKAVKKDCAYEIMGDRVFTVTDNSCAVLYIFVLYFRTNGERILNCMTIYYTKAIVCHNISCVSQTTIHHLVIRNMFLPGDLYKNVVRTKSWTTNDYNRRRRTCTHLLDHHACFPVANKQSMSS